MDDRPEDPQSPAAHAATVAAQGGERGCLFLVVGPSGAGKDSVIDGLRSRFADDPRVCFPRRYITRDANAGGEGHVPVTAPFFATLHERGEFLLSWKAHGLGYGIGRDAADALAAGRHVVANVSRGVLEHARLALQPVRVLHVTAGEDTLRHRLTHRGRESSAAVKARLARALAFTVSGEDVTTVANDGDLALAVAAAADAIETYLRECRA